MNYFRKRSNGTYIFDVDLYSLFVTLKHRELHLLFIIQFKIFEPIKQ
jgi:hypothetical protein